MSKQKILLVLLASVSLSLSSLAAENIRFDRLTAEQGLPQSTILAFAQDNQGFIWFGTQEGLNRYDGYEFVTYIHDSEDPTSLAHDWVSALYIDRQGRLWVGMDGGALDRYDPVTDSFTHVIDNPHGGHRNYVQAMLEDRTDALWVGVEGLGVYRIDPVSQTISQLRANTEDPASLSSDEVKSMVLDSQGIIWIGTNGGGLNRLNPETQTIHRTPIALSGTSATTDLRINTIAAVGAEQLWLGTFEGGILRLNTRSGDVTSYRHQPDNPGSLSSDAVRVLLRDTDGLLWVGTEGGGLNRFDPVSGTFDTFHNIPADFRSLNDDHIISLFQDRGGVIWVGTMAGINKWNPAMGAFTTYTRLGNGTDQLSNNWVTSFAQTDLDHIWVGTHGGGLNRVDLATGKAQHYLHSASDPNSLSDDRVFSLAAISNRVLWVGTRAGGLNRMNVPLGTFEHFMHDPADPTSLSSDGVTALMLDEQNRLWVATYLGGLDLYQPETRNFRHFTHQDQQPDSISSNRVLGLIQDARNRIWVATHDGGICRIKENLTGFDCIRHDPDDPKSLNSDATWAIHEDRRGNLWIGTQDSGLNLWRAEDRAADRRVFAHYGRAQGLPSNMVYAAVSDLAGYIWLSTNHGISRFDPVAEEFRNYDVTHGLQNNEFNFAAYFRSPDGSLYFGGISGFNHFQPEQIRINNHPPEIAMTSVFRMNQRINPYLLTANNAVFDLNHRDTLVSFEYVALDYTAPASNTYMHRLIGFDEAWQRDGKVRRATYTNLKPGDYTFQVLARNNDGVQSVDALNLKIHVAPPRWATLWAQLSYLLLTIGLVLLIIRGLRRRAAIARQIQSTNESLEQEIERRQAQEAALHREKQLAQSYLDVVEVIIIALDPEGTITLVNQKGIRVLNYTEQDLVGQNFYEFLVPRPYREKIRKQFSEVTEYDYSESPVTTSDGTERLIAWHETPLNNNGDAAKGLLISGIDITQTRNLEHQVRETQKMEALGTLAGGIAHDFNNVLSSMMGFTELSLGEVDPGSSIHRHLERTMISINRARDLVQGILTFSRKASQDPTATSIQAVVQESLQLLRPSLPSNIAIQLNVDNNTGAVLADPNQLHQLVMNLCTNAYQAMAEAGGVLKLEILSENIGTESARSNTSLKPGIYVKLVVTDSGHGISQAHIDRIFEPFFTTKKRGEGTGLGLSIVHGIVNQIGGSIHVQSRLGQGTRFEVFLPQCSEEVAETDVPLPISNLSLTGTETLLFVDDEQSMIAIAQEALGKLGYTIYTASDAREALDKWQHYREEIDIVITDHTMPNMLGSELAEKLHQLNANIPLILMSGGDVELRNRASVDLFLNKPFTAVELARVIRRLLDTWKTTENESC